VLSLVTGAHHRDHLRRARFG